MKIKYLIIAFILIFNSCRNCEDTSEPTLCPFFTDYSNYELFYGIGSTDTLEMTYEMPMAINSDTSIYILFGLEKTDTLGISYKRLIRYNSEKCGFSITLDSFKLLDISTYDSAEFKISDNTQSMFGDFNKNYYEVILYR